MGPVQLGSIWDYSNGPILNQSGTFWQLDWSCVTKILSLQWFYFELLWFFMSCTGN